LGGGVHARIPLMSGDFYVDRNDSTKFWQVLHFGLQNIYASDLDEWMVMSSFRRGPGTVTVPEECLQQPETPSTTTTASTTARCPRPARAVTGAAPGRLLVDAGEGVRRDRGGRVGGRVVVR